MRASSVYVVVCDCGAIIETPDTQTACKCGLAVRIEWQWQGDELKGGTK